MPEPLALISPRTARDLSLSEGDWARASTDRGEINIKISIDKSIHDKLLCISNNIESWTVNFVEASNEFYGGKFPVCPYARQARIKGETTYAIYPGGNLKQFIQHSVDQLLADDKLKQNRTRIPCRFGF